MSIVQFRGYRAPQKKARIAIEVLETRRLLASIIVNSTADNLIAGDGLTTLREAITQAAADASPDTISFNLGAGAHTIDLSSDLPPLAQSAGSEIILQGPGADLLTVRP